MHIQNFPTCILRKHTHCFGNTTRTTGIARSIYFY